MTPPKKPFLPDEPKRYLQKVLSSTAFKGMGKEKQLCRRILEILSDSHSATPVRQNVLAEKLGLNVDDADQKDASTLEVRQAIVEMRRTLLPDYYRRNPGDP